VPTMSQGIRMAVSIWRPPTRVSSAVGRVQVGVLPVSERSRACVGYFCVAQALMLH
jgi:hypothetical protein